jgi:Fur family ferric uptake transcriptional regulator
MHTDEEARQLLKDAKLRVTSGRISLLAVMLKESRPLSMDTASDLCGWKGGDRATVFRNLQALSEAGLIRMVRSAGKRDVYELAKRPGSPSHAHAVCTKCGKVECVDSTAALAGTAPPRGWKLTSQEVTIWGLCPSCEET